MCELIEDLMMLADKCSEDNPTDELGLLLVRAVGQMRGDAAALAAKDARIAELEQQLAATPSEDGQMIDTSAWQACNPGCDPEFNGEKGRHCVCDPAKAAMSEKRASSINPEMVDVVGYTTAGMLSISKDLPITGRIGAKCKPDERWNVPLMTVAQHSRIVAAKDAEIARLRELHENAHSAARALMSERATLMEQAAHWLEVNAPSGGCIETNIADELRAEAEQLRAQPARQVGVSVSRACQLIKLAYYEGQSSVGGGLCSDFRWETSKSRQDADALIAESSSAENSSQVGEPDAWMCVNKETGERDLSIDPYAYIEDADGRSKVCVVPLYRASPPYTSCHAAVDEPPMSDYLRMANEAFGTVVDHDLKGNPITDYDVLLNGAYGPAVRRLVEFAVKREKTAQASVACVMPEGWKLVPIHPTEDMLRSAMQYDRGQSPDEDPAIADSLRTDWSLMLGSAPAARLNRNPIPVELIKQATHFLEAHASANSIEQGIADELRALLGEGGEQ